MSHDAPQSPAEDALLGRVINERFRVVAEVSRDHVGRVYRAEQLPLGRPVSLKVLDPRHGTRGEEGEGQFQQRFLIEASIAARLSHPNTVQVFDYGCTPEGLCFTTFELVEGRTLAAVLAEARVFTAERVLHVALQMARSLREAHRVGIIHSNLKPSSVLLTRHGDEDDFVKVCDFGLVRPEGAEENELTQRGSLSAGAFKYMSPERIRGDRSDARADIYSLGVCMYEMLTGHVPFDRPSAVGILMAHMQEAAPPIERFDCPPQLARLVISCLAKTPAERPASMDDVILLLKKAAGRSAHPTMQFTVSQELMMTPSRPLPGVTEGSFAMALPTMAQPPSSAAPTLPPHAPRRPWLPKLAVLTAIVLAAGFLALRQREAGAARPAAMQREPEAPRVEAALASRPTTRSGEPFRLRVQLTSLPAGAYVEVAGRRYGPTPADVELWGDEVTPGREVTFVFDKPGYERASATRLVRGESLVIEAVLGRVGTGRSAAAVRSAPVEAAAEPSYARLEQWPALSEQASPPSLAAAASAPDPAALAPAASASAAPAANKAPAKVASLASHSALVRDQPRKFPDYPRAALRAGISGTVVARVHVSVEGRVSAVDVLDGPDVFHEAVRVALMTWRYTPARLTDGKPVPDTHIVRVPFQLK
jgi:TonB family protein